MSIESAAAHHQEKTNMPLTLVSRMIPKRGGDDGSRDGLRAAIEAREKAADAVVKHRGAISRARQLVTAAAKKADRAAGAISEAKSEAARVMADAIVSGDDDVAERTGVIRARMMEIQSAEDFEAAQAVLERLQAQQADIENALALADGGVTAAVNALLAPLARAALEQLRELDRQAAPRLALLKFILEIGTERGPRFREDDVAELRLEKDIHQPLEGLRGQVNAYFAGRGAGAEAIRRAWAQSREALRTDPDAPLPAGTWPVPAT
jgi:hypothetical protein